MTTERRVSVRLVAVGGSQLKAELLQLGQDGARALGMVAGAAPLASDWLVRTGQAAGQASGRIEEIGRRSGAAGRALREMAATITPLVAQIDRLTGVSGRTARSGADIEAYGTALDNLQARFSPVFAAQLQHRRQVAEINEAHRVGAISADELAAAVVRSRVAMEAATEAARAREAALMGLVQQESVLARVNRTTGVSGGVAREAADIEAYGTALDDLQARFSPVFAAQLQHRRQVAEINEAHRVGAISADELAAAVVRSRVAMEAATQAARAREAALMGLVEQETLLARVNRTTGVSGGIARDGADIEAYGRELDELRARFNPVFAAQQRYQQGLASIRQAHRVGAISADEMTDAIARQGRQLEWTLAQLRTVDTAAGEAGRSVQFVGHRVANLSFQLNDIGVSLAGGQNPFTVMIQQGAQIAQIYGFGGGGVGGLMADLRGMLTGVLRAITMLPARFPAVTAALAATGAALAGVRAEMRGLGVEAPGFLETARASVEVLASRVRDALRPAFELLRPVIEAVGGWFRDTMVAVWEAVKTGINGVINAFRIGYQSVLLAWEGLPDAIGGFVIGAANATIRGVNMLMERVTLIINRAIDGINDRVARLADFAGFEFTPFGRMDAPQVGELENPGADRTSERVAAFLAAVRDINASDPVGGFMADVRERILANRAALEEVEEAAGGAGRAQADAADEAATGWAAVAEALREYAAEALDWGSDLGRSLVSTFRGAEEAVAQFVKTGKLDFRDMVTSMIADMARLAARRFILGPLAGLLGGALGGFTAGGAGTMASVLHGGGMVGTAGTSRRVPALAFAGAPRLHSGGWIGPDEVPAILQRGERVLSRREAKGWGASPVNVTIMARDVESFRASRAQIGSDIARAVAAGRRGM